MKQNKLKNFIAGLAGKKQSKDVNLGQYIKSYEETKVVTAGMFGPRTLRRPSIELDVNELAKLREVSEGFGRIYEVENNNHDVQHVLEFGFYVEDSDLKDRDLKFKRPKLTGKSYHFLDVNNQNTEYPEIRLSNGERMVKYEKDLYFKITPLKWIIDEKNWSHLPKSFNPGGDGQESVLKLQLNKYLVRQEVAFKEEAFMVAPELLEMSGVKNVDNLINDAKQDECEKGL